ncbi:MAG: hypothetical protein C0434_08030 [Xanthomonadaceae bacterium]|nr:hypothetical protein [Xanthomonadaceae bacterium]
MDEAYYRQRVSTLEGMVRERDGRIRTLDGELTEARSSIQRLTQTNADLAAKLAAAPPAPINLLDYFSQEDIDDMGEAEAMRQAKALRRLEQRVAKPEPSAAPIPAQAAPQPPAPPVDNSRAQLVSVFQAELSRAVPGWETWAVGEHCDPRFATWLAQRAEGSIKTRGQLLAEAEQVLDHVPIVELLQSFLRSLGVDPSRRLDPNSRLAPEGVGSGGGDPPPPADVPKDAMRLSEIQQFTADLAKGKYRGRAQEAAEMQSRIDRAVRNQAVIKDV